MLLVSCLPRAEPNWRTESERCKNLRSRGSTGSSQRLLFWRGKKVRFGHFFEGRKVTKGSAMLLSWQHRASPFLQLRVGLGPRVRQKIRVALICVPCISVFHRCMERRSNVFGTLKALKSSKYISGQAFSNQHQSLSWQYFFYLVVYCSIRLYVSLSYAGVLTSWNCPSSMTYWNSTITHWCFIVPCVRWATTVWPMPSAATWTNHSSSTLLRAPTCLVLSAAATMTFSSVSTWSQPNAIAWEPIVSLLFPWQKRHSASSFSLMQRRPMTCQELVSQPASDPSYTSPQSTLWVLTQICIPLAPSSLCRYDEDTVESKTDCF